MFICTRVTIKREIICSTEKPSMASGLLFLLGTLILCKVSPSIHAAKAEPLFRITDDNWRMMLEGEWMVEL
jgi:hypothetical protein